MDKLVMANQLDIVVVKRKKVMPLDVAISGGRNTRTCGGFSAPLGNQGLGAVTKTG